MAVLGAIVTDLAGIAFEPRHRTLLLLSQESTCIVQTSLEGTVLGPPAPVGGSQPEGIALTPDEGTLYIISEPNQILEYGLG